MTSHGDQDMCKTKQKLLVTVVTACQQKSRSMTSNKRHNMALASNNNFPLQLFPHAKNVLFWQFDNSSEVIFVNVQNMLTVDSIQFNSILYSHYTRYLHKCTWQENRDLQIQGRERLRVRDLTSSFFAYSQNIDSPESFILPFFTRKVSTVTFSEGGCTLS